MGYPSASVHCFTQVPTGATGWKGPRMIQLKMQARRGLAFRRSEAKAN